MEAEEMGTPQTITSSRRDREREWRSGLHKPSPAAGEIGKENGELDFTNHHQQQKRWEKK
jgi:hypothetical protein